MEWDGKSWEGSPIQRLTDKAKLSAEGRREFIDYFERLYGERVRDGWREGRAIIGFIEETYIGYEDWAFELREEYRRRFFSLLSKGDQALLITEDTELWMARKLANNPMVSLAPFWVNFNFTPERPYTGDTWRVELLDMVEGEARDLFLAGGELARIKFIELRRMFISVKYAHVPDLIPSYDKRFLPMLPNEDRDIIRKELIQEAIDNDACIENPEKTEPPSKPQGFFKMLFGRRNE